MLKFEKRINYLLHLKYKTSPQTYDINIVDNIIFNDTTHLVSKFKDYLIEFEEYDFLKRYYTKEESKKKLKRILEYYKKYSLLFPNYSAFPESELIYKNINLKQKIIDNIENDKNKTAKFKENEKETVMKNNLNLKESSDNLVFNSNVYDSIFKETENCLSLFSFDKESTFSENKEEGINKIINCFNKIDKSGQNNKKEITQNKNIIIYKSLNIENEDINTNVNNNNSNKSINKTNSNRIYKRKKTPNNLINSRHKNIFSSHNLNLRKKHIIDNEEQISNNKTKNSNTNNSINESGSVLLSNKKKGIYKKIKLSFIEHSEKENNRSSSYIRSSRTKPVINKNIKINVPSPNKALIENKTLINQINNIPIKINLLVDEKSQPSMIKVNIKKDKKNKNSKFDNKLILNSNKFFDFHRIPKTNNSLNNQKIHTKLKNSSNIKNNKEYLKNSIHEINNNNNSYNNSNLLKENKMHLIKYKIKNAESFNYVINNYNSKLISYNTSIQFNSNNINIFNSNNNHSNSLINIYRNDQFNKSINLCDKNSLNKSNNLRDSIPLNKSSNLREYTPLYKSSNLRETTSFNKSNKVRKNNDLNKNTNKLGSFLLNKKNNIRGNISFNKSNKNNDNTSFNKSHNIRENTPFNKNSNYSDFIHSTPYEKKIVVSENNKIKNRFLNKTSYSTSFNNNNKKRRRIISKEMLKSLDKKHLNNKITNNDIVINSERLSVPINTPLNNKLLSKLNIRPRNDSNLQKYKTISKNKDKDKNRNKHKDFRKTENFKEKKQLITKNNININNENNCTLNINKSENIYNYMNQLGNFYIKNININEDYKKKIEKEKRSTLYMMNNNNSNCNNINNIKIKKNYIKRINKKNYNKELEYMNERYFKEKELKILNESNEEIYHIKKHFFKIVENKYNNSSRYYKLNDNGNGSSKRIFLAHQKYK